MWTWDAKNLFFQEPTFGNLSLLLAHHFNWLSPSAFPHWNIQNLGSRRPLESSYDETTNLDNPFEGGWDSVGIQHVDWLGFRKPIVMYNNGNKTRLS